MKAQTSRQKQAAATKRKIFMCAVSLFAEHAYEKVTINDIANEAQVSVGAFYHHYKNKESILNEGYRMFDDQLQEQWKNGHPSDCLKAMHFLVDHQMQSMEQMGALASAQYFKNQLSNEEKYILNKERFFYITIHDLVQEAILNGMIVGDTQTITDDILSSCRGTIYDWCLHEGNYSLTDKGSRVLDMVIHYYQR